jgi:hypothetical protein
MVFFRDVLGIAHNNRKLSSICCNLGNLVLISTKEKCLFKAVRIECDIHKSNRRNPLSYVMNSTHGLEVMPMKQMKVRASFYLVCEATGTAATPGLLCQPRVMIVKMIVEKQMECRLTGETEVLGENLPQRHFCPSQNPT